MTYIMAAKYGERLVEAIDEISQAKHLILDTDRSRIGDTGGLSASEIYVDRQRFALEADRAMSSDNGEFGFRNEDDSRVEAPDIILPFNPAHPDDLLDGVIGMFPSVEIAIERSNNNKGVFYFSQDQRLRGLGARAIFPYQNHFVDALNFQRSVLWLDLSRTDNTIRSMPHLPFVLIGHKPGGRFSGDQVLAVPLGMTTVHGQEVDSSLPQGECEYTEGQKGFGSRIIQDGKKKSTGLSEIAQKGAIHVLDGVDNILTGVIDTVFGETKTSSSRQRSGSSSGEKKPPQVHRFRFPLHMVYQFNMSKKGYELFSESQRAALSDYTQDEVVAIYDQSRDQIAIDERSPRSIHNGGIRSGLFKKASNRSPQVLLTNPDQVVFRDQEVEAFAVIEHLARLTVNFGVADKIKSAVRADL